MFSTALNLPETDRAQIADLLNQQLANLSDLSSQTKQAHWNVHGRHFYHQHKLFEELFGIVDAHLDTLAERIVTLGGYAEGTVRAAAAHSRLPEIPREQTNDLGFIEVLSAQYAETANQVRLAIDAADQIGDATSADLLTSISRDLDKSLWFLEAHLREASDSFESGSDSNAEADGGAPTRQEPVRRQGTRRPAKQPAPARRGAGRRG